jgi:SNF2 family DNA or RNA helicase
MLVLHASWDAVKLHIWAESSVLPLNAERIRGRPPKRPKPRPHPFTLPGDELYEEITSIFGEVPSSIDPISFFLPSAKKGPLPSPWLIREDHITEKAAGLLVWKIDTLAFDPLPAFNLLNDMPAHPPHGFAMADSLRFWMEAASLSLELITREQFVPTVKAGRAVWTAVIFEEDSKRLNLLSESLPPSCRAYYEADESQPRSPLELVKSFIDGMLDAFVRQSLKTTDLLLPLLGRLPKVVPVPHQFLMAICCEESLLNAAPEELNSFSDEMQTWLARLNPAPSVAPFQTCFRLETPSIQEDEEDWRIRYFIQARDDRSLLIPADEVWKARSDTLTFLKRSFKNPQEQLLADLGRASRVFPLIERSLQTARPGGLELNTKQAYSFLRESAPLLEQNGFGVLLPSWWDKPSERIGVKIRLKDPLDRGGPTIGRGLFGLDSILDYDWEVAIGDETFSEAEFKEMARLKVPLVQVRGEWVMLRSEDIESAIAYFEKRSMSSEMTLMDALKLGLGAQDLGSEESLPVVEVEAKSWFEDMLSSFAGGDRISDVEVPKTFNGKLRPYQEKGLSWLNYLHKFGLGACLSDDMGLGKTVQLIVFLLHEREINVGAKILPTLLICPMSVAGNWQKEVERFAPSLKVMIHHGINRFTDGAFAVAAEKHDLVITTYATAQRDEETLSTVHWQHIVLDEAQNIKNPGAKQTQVIKRLKTKHRIALTGTPVENRLSELWSILDFLNPGYLGSAKGFRKDFAFPIEKYRNKERAEMLRQITQPFILRRLKTDPAIIKDLPEKIETKVYSNLTPEQASLYEAHVSDLLEKIDSTEGIERKGLILAALTRLKQICNHPALFLQDGSSLDGRSGKLIRLEEMLEEVLAEGDKALIFTQFAGMGAMLRHHLQEKLQCETLFLHGKTPKKQRDQMIQRFQSDGPPIFILSLKAGGLGLNLTAANYVFHFDRWWNPAVEDQATDRVFRIGQEKNVFSNKFVCIGTLEERIDQMIEDKKALADSVIGAGEAWLTELSTDELRDIFSLGRDAARVGD